MKSNRVNFTDELQAKINWQIKEINRLKEQHKDITQLIAVRDECSAFYLACFDGNGNILESHKGLTYEDRIKIAESVTDPVYINSANEDEE